MDEKRILKILKVILEWTGEEEFEWRLDGSVNLFVQGVYDAQPRDIDIRTWEEGIKIFRDKLKKYIVKDFYNDEKKAYSLILKIFGEEVEINYYSEWNDDKNLKIKIVVWNDLKLKCLPLEEAERLYRRIGRIESANKLKKFLSSNK